MHQFDYSERLKTRFSEYNDDQWNILYNQMVKKFGSALLLEGEDFDFNSQLLKIPVPDKRHYWVLEFRNEYFQRINRNDTEGCGNNQ
jgi:hypothetical protein